MKKNNKAAAFFAALIITLNALPLPAVHADGTIVITTANDFRNFTEKCVYDEYSKNTTFVLQNDIDLKDSEITAAEVFCGTFDGAGHTIKNIKIKTDGSAKGLFGTVSNGAAIRDLKVTGTVEVSQKAKTDTQSILRRRASEILKNDELNTDSLDASSKAVGGIAGYNEGKIVNCSFSGKISGTNQVGGIAGSNAMTGIIDNCINEAAVTGDCDTGGIAGYNEGRIKLSVNKGAVCGETTENTIKAGGICGNNKGAVVICTNNGSVGAEGFGDNMGGICGIESGEIRECINNAEVKGRRSVGGICGRFEPYTDIDLSYESAKEAVRNQAQTLKNDLGTAKGKLIDYAAGLISGGDTSSLLSLLGLSSGASRLNDAAVNMMDSISDAVTNAKDNNVSSAVRDALNSGSSDLSNISEETVNTMRDLSDTADSLRNFLDEFDGKGKEISDTLDNLNDALDKGKEDTGEIKDKLITQLDDLSGDIDDLTSKLDKTHSELNSMMRQVKYAAGDISDLAEHIDDAVVKTANELKRLNDSIQQMIQSIKGTPLPTLKPLPTLRPLHTLTPLKTLSPTDKPEGYNVETDEELDTGYDVIASIKNMLTTTAYAAEDDKTLLSDLKTTEISLPRLIGGENADTALILYCINNGNVKGSELAGGIAGSMGFESAVKNGQNITLPDGRKVDKDAILKAVVNGCISCGNITAKNEYAGGAVGRSDLGNIKNTLTTGEITAENGGYAGGTAGLSGGEIMNCIAINDVEGNDHIGGIAGSGKDIKGSYALPRLDGKKEKSGAVAGFVSGEIASCYFIDEGLSGIDGANLANKAEPVKPKDIVSSDGNIPPAMQGLSTDDYYMASDDIFMPQIKFLAKNSAENIGALLQSKSAELSRFHFNVIFKNKGEELHSLTVEYGTELSAEDIPKLPSEGGNVPVWDKDVQAPIIRHTTFNAEYNKATTTISSGEEPPLLLVESVFDEGTEVTLREEDISHTFSGYKNGGAYSFTLSRDAYGVIKIHIRDDKKKAAKIGIFENGKWETVDCVIDGSYAVFEINEPAQFVILYKHVPPIAVILIILTSAALAAAVFIVVRRRNYGRSKEKIQEL